MNELENSHKIVLQKYRPYDSSSGEYPHSGSRWYDFAETTPDDWSGVETWSAYVKTDNSFRLIERIVTEKEFSE
jgi:hypothetical protein